MKRILTLVIAVLLLSVSPVLGTPLVISPAQAWEIMQSGEPFILLDVRRADEYAAGRIAGSMLIPHTEINARAAAELPDKDALILVYCQAGARSANAAASLAALGYTNVRDFGGIGSWTYGTISGAAIFTGSGTASSPYEIRTAIQLAQLAEQVNAGNAAYNAAHYRLLSNIDFSKYAGWTTIGTSANPFRGTLDGGSINNLVIVRPNYGDTDGDGNINAADVTLLRRYIAAEDKEEFLKASIFNEANADVNGDGKICATDVTLLRLYIAAPGNNKPILGPQ
jgi:rhodanese-related sulfurtransferase